jgi:putative glycosyltransferase (TIGR04348 family)
VRIGIVTPAPRGSRTGNRVTALRYARIFRSLGHRAAVRQEFHGEAWDLLVAIHAAKSAASIDRRRGRGPLVVVLSGTDVYGGNRIESLEAADRIVAFQPLAVEAIPGRFREKCRVIHQSARSAGPAEPAAPGRFAVCVLGHLRAVKDPFLVAEAVRDLPAGSRILALHVGRALDAGSERRANEEGRTNPRWRWLGERRRAEALRILAGSRLFVLPSRSEGGANVLMEALAAGVPILASRVPGNVGLLGDGYPGYFEAGDAAGLRALLERAEREASFEASLAEWCRRLRPLADPERERRSWEALLKEVLS